MSAPLVITISHQLGKEVALQRIKAGLAKAADFPVLKVESEAWSGDRLDFRVRSLGQVAVGNIQVGDRDIRLEVTLPWLLQRFAEVVQRTVTSRGRILLEKK